MTNTITHGDVNFTYNGNVVVLSHTAGQFPPFTCSRYCKRELLKCLYTTDNQKLKVMVDTSFGYYFIINDKGVCIDISRNYSEVVEKAKEWDANYLDFLAEHTAKGLGKQRFINDVKAGKLKAKLIYSFKGVSDDSFHPLVKRDGYGSIDIVRDGRHSALFYINSMSAVQLVYNAQSLKIYQVGYRVMNAHEQQVYDTWQGMRDLEEERLDSLTDGSSQYWRKKRFFEDNGCAHLMTDMQDGLVRDSKVRGPLLLHYHIQYN